MTGRGANEYIPELFVPPQQYRAFAYTRETRIRGLCRRISAHQHYGYVESRAREFRRGPWRKKNTFGVCVCVCVCARRRTRMT